MELSSGGGHPLTERLRDLEVARAAKPLANLEHDESKKQILRGL